MLKDCRWPIHAALTRKTAIQEVGGFDERYPTSEDFFLWLRIAANHSLVRVPSVLAYYHHHSGPRATRNLINMARNHWLVQREFLHDHPEVPRRLGKRRVKELTDGVLLQRGYSCYWHRDLEAARVIFRMVMKTGYGALNDWKYMLPSLLPFFLHQALVDIKDKTSRGHAT